MRTAMRTWIGGMIRGMVDRRAIIIQQVRRSTPVRKSSYLVRPRVRERTSQPLARCGSILISMPISYKTRDESHGIVHRYSRPERGCSCGSRASKVKPVIGIDKCIIVWAIAIRPA